MYLFQVINHLNYTACFDFDSKIKCIAGPRLLPMNMHCVSKTNQNRSSHGTFESRLSHQDRICIRGRRLEVQVWFINNLSIMGQWIPWICIFALFQKWFKWLLKLLLQHFLIENYIISKMQVLTIHRYYSSEWNVRSWKITWFLKYKLKCSSRSVHWQLINRGLKPCSKAASRLIKHLCSFNCKLFVVLLQHYSSS